MDADDWVSITDKETKQKRKKKKVDQGKTQTKR